MNVGTQIRRFVQINLVSHLKLMQVRCEAPKKAASTSVLSGGVKCMQQPHMSVNSSLDFCRIKTVGCAELLQLHCRGSIGDLQRTVDISEPGVASNFNVGLPISPLVGSDFDLPTVRQTTEVIDPAVGGVVVRKEAFKLRRIRRKKMKKHKHKKVMKKLKFFYEKLKLRRRAKKEAVFQGILGDIIKDGLQYSAESQHKENLDLLNWKQPLNRVKGSLSPKWFVDLYLEEEKRRQQVQDKVEYCLKKRQGE